MKEDIMYSQLDVNRQLYYANKYIADISVFDQPTADEFTMKVSDVSKGDFDKQWVEVSHLLDVMRAVISAYRF
jgi:hypothetical protein